VADLLFADFLGCAVMWADIFAQAVVIICFILKTEAVFPSNLHLFFMKRMFNNQDYTEAKDDHDFHLARKKTTVEKEVESHHVQAHEVVTHLSPTPTVQAYIPQALSGAIFCGHLVTDLDSIAGAIGAAELYGGIPARASEVNSETAFALQEWGVEKPRPIEELLVELPNAGVCLVDHQQTSQLNKSIDVSQRV
jgi:hypothetical protein